MRKSRGVGPLLPVRATARQFYYSDFFFFLTIDSLQFIFNFRAFFFFFQDWDVQVKTKDNSPLTKADLSANKVICDALTECYPDIPM